MQFLAGLILRIVVFRVVDMAQVKREVPPCFGVEVGEGEVGIIAIWPFTNRMWNWS